MTCDTILRENVRFVRQTFSSIRNTHNEMRQTDWHWTDQLIVGCAM